MSEIAASAVTIGAFDGVHRGHQAVIERLRAVAAAQDAEPVVVTFDPLPREFLLGDDAPPRIQTLDDRMTALAALGIRQTACIDFDDALAAMDATSFVERVLVEWLGARAVVVGDDFRFGNQRAGDFTLLRTLGERHGFVVEAAPTCADGGERISSSRIRALLADGDVGGAAALLGRPYAVSGEVTHGAALGRKLGFPTANLVPGVRLALAEGSYAARVRVGDGPWRRAAAYWGHARVEAHLLDFVGNLYGQRLTVEFERFVRAHEKIDDLAVLRERIASDIEESRG